MESNFKYDHRIPTGDLEIDVKFYDHTIDPASWEEMSNHQTDRQRDRQTTGIRPPPYPYISLFFPTINYKQSNNVLKFKYLLLFISLVCAVSSTGFCEEWI